MTFLSALSALFQVCIVTGANAGIGLATATELARMGAHVVLACRSKERGQAAAEVRKARVTPKFLACAFVHGLFRTGHLFFDL